MADLRTRIQIARVADDAGEWSKLLGELFATDLREGMKAALSGAVRGTPGGAVKALAPRIAMAHASALGLIDLRAAMDAAVTASIYASPGSDTRREATGFIVAHAESFSLLDGRQATEHSQFAVQWAEPGSETAAEAARVWGRLSVAPPAGVEAEDEGRSVA